MADRIIRKGTAKTLRAYRESHGNMTQAQLADFLGFSLGSIAKWEGEDPKDIPKSQYVIEISEKLGISCDELLTGKKTEFVDACHATGLSSETIETLSHRDSLESLYIRTVIEPLLNHAEMLYFAHALLHGAAILSSIDEYSGPTEEDEYILSGITWSMMQRFNSIVEKAMWEIVRLSSKNSSISELLEHNGNLTAAMDFVGVMSRPESEDKQ